MLIDLGKTHLPLRKTVQKLLYVPVVDLEAQKTIKYTLRNAVYGYVTPRNLVEATKL